MRLVVDTNVIFSAMIADGKTRELLLTADLALYIPEYFHLELSNNLTEIEAKTGLDRSELGLLIDLLFEDLHVVPRASFEDELADAANLIGDTDPDDVPFLALALHLDAGLWSDDEDFSEQAAVDVWRTHELVASLG